MNRNVDAIAAMLRADAQLCADTLSLALGDCTLRVRSNSAAVIAGLRQYFSHVPAGSAQPDMEVIAIEREPPDTGIDFVDWQREPGKAGRKDSFFDIPGGRVVRKVRTGMVFLQSETQRIAAGPCLEFDNQVINFINAQYMNWLQHRGWLICHSAGLVYRGKGFGIAGFSGGGKSTLMLQLLDHDEVCYLTNDRLFVRREASKTRALGIPKLPRVNPGTIVHNARLQALIPAERRAELLAMPAAELWHLEDKYDVHIDQVYGPGRVVPGAPLGGYLVLNWRRDSDAPLRVEPVVLDNRRDLLAAIMKSPGPFYQYPDGSFHRDDAEFDEQAYLDALQGVAVHEVSGRIEFDALARICLSELLVSN
jgi:HprK-related kinase B